MPAAVAAIYANQFDEGAILSGPHTSGEPDRSAQAQESELIAADVARQAVDALGGYVYQALQALLDWLGLPSQGLLFLEVAQDYAVAAEGALRGVQVKRTASNVTLRSKSALETLQAFWQMRAANATSDVSITYLTTAAVGKEQGFTLPGGAKGIDYWRAVATGADTEPLRELLLALPLPDGLVAFLQSAPAESLRDTLVRRINWITEAPNAEGVRAAIEARLVELGEQFGVFPDIARRSFDPLLVEVLRTSTGPAPRSLSRARLLEIFQDACTVRTPLGRFRNVDVAQGIGAPALALSPPADLLEDLPLPRPHAPRIGFTASNAAILADHGALWLHGGSGMGKTAAGQLAARACGGEWRLLSLRGLNGVESGRRIHQLLAQIGSGLNCDVMIDDFEAHEDAASETPTAMLIDALRRRDRRLLVTAYIAPTARLLSRCGLEEAVVDVPAFTVEEVSELIDAMGGDSQRWAAPVLLSTGGHPQLVSARLKGLKAQDWPDELQLQDLIEDNRDLEDTRASVRRSLLKNLPADAMELLKRLSLNIGRFDRSLALALGSSPPPVGQAGDHLDLLTGPWLEPLPGGRLRLSPLLSNLGRDLPAATKSALHTAAADELVSRQSLDPSDAAELFMHALAARHELGLAAVAAAVIRASVAERAYVANALTVLVTVTTERPVFPENPRVNILLRLAQVHIAVARGLTNQLPRLSGAMFGELQLLDPGQQSVSLEVAAILALGDHWTDLDPAWFTRLRRLRLVDLSSPDDVLAVRAISEEEGALHPLQFLLSSAILRSVGPQQVAATFAELDGSDGEERRFWLRALNRHHGDVQLFIENSWVRAQPTNPTEARDYAGEYLRLAAIAADWDEEELSVECRIAAAVMLDEYAASPDEALQLLEETRAAGVQPRFRIDRSKAKVHFRARHDDTAWGIMQSLEPMFGDQPLSAPVYLYREAAVIAGRCGDWREAGRLFLAAEARTHDVLLQTHLAHWRPGLISEASHAAAKAGDLAVAMALAKRALEASEAIDPLASLKARFAHMAVGHLVVWLCEFIEGRLPTGPEGHIEPGALSNPEPHPGLEQRPPAPPATLWYELAAAEVQLRADLGILEALRARHPLSACSALQELLIRRPMVSRAAETLDHLGLVHALSDYFTAFQVVRSQGDYRSQDIVFAPVIAPMPDRAPEEFDSEDEMAEVGRQVMTYGLFAAARANAGAVQALLDALPAPWAGDALLAELGRCLLGAQAATRAMDTLAAEAIGAYLAGRDPGGPDELLMLSAYAAFRLGADKHPPTSVEEVVRWLASLWTHAASSRRFLFRTPAVHCPAILEAAQSSRSLADLAGLALAANGAGRVGLTPADADKLRAIAGDRPPPA